MRRLGAVETEVGQRDLGTRRSPLELSGASPHSGDTESTCVPGHVLWGGQGGAPLSSDFQIRLRSFKNSLDFKKQIPV